MTEHYAPTYHDMMWAANMLQIMNDGGVWAIPGNCSTYIFDHTNKKLIRTATADPKDTTEIHSKTIAVFNAVGYSVVDAEDLQTA